jgi:hypothetical protein
VGLAIRVVLVFALVGVVTLAFGWVEDVAARRRPELIPGGPVQATEMADQPDTEGREQPDTEGREQPDTEGREQPDTEGRGRPDEQPAGATLGRAVVPPQWVAAARSDVSAG